MKGCPPSREQGRTASLSHHSSGSCVGCVGVCVMVRCVYVCYDPFVRVFAWAGVPIPSLRIYPPPPFCFRFSVASLRRNFFLPEGGPILGGFFPAPTPHPFQFLLSFDL
eukprot:RCo049952